MSFCTLFDSLMMGRMVVGLLQEAFERPRNNMGMPKLYDTSPSLMNHLHFRPERGVFHDALRRKQAFERLALERIPVKNREALHGRRKFSP